MAEVSIRDLRNHGGNIVDRVQSGERVTITRSGTPVAEIRPLAPRGLTAEALLERWRHLPAVDPTRFRADIDELIDPAL